jgi:hypothetical protein
MSSKNFGISAEIAVRDLLLGEIRHEDLEILNTVINASEGACGEPAVAPGLILGRAFQHQHRHAVLGRRERRTKRRIAGADNDDIYGGG